MTSQNIPAALIVDLASFEGMSREDAIAYAVHMGQTVTNLRAQNIPVMWCTIGPGGNKLVIPEDPEDRQPYDFNFLVGEMAFDKMHGQGENSGIHHRFLEEFGPRRNEVVYRKISKDTLLDPNDLAEKSEDYTRTLLENEVGLLVAAGVSPHEILEQQFNDPPLSKFSQERGINQLLIMGGMSNHCICETAIGAARKGINAIIAVDSILSWDRPITTREERESAGIVWETEIFPGYHKDMVETALAEMSSDPARDYLAADLQQIEQIKLSTAENFIAEAQSSIPTFSTSVVPANSLKS